jgi:1-acyl-sn-glycerol-3-phosphate acyltransferase
VPAIRLVCRPFVVERAAPLPAGPVVLVANHASHLDALAVLAALPPAARARTAPAAAEDYFYRSWPTGAAVTLSLGAFPFPRDRGCRPGLARTAALLAAGWNVLLFPEGTRSADARIAPFKRGAAHLARATGRPLVPVGIVGAGRVLPRGGRWPRPGPVAVRFGPAWTPPSDLDVDQIADQLRARVARLVEHGL